VVDYEVPRHTGWAAAVFCMTVDHKRTIESRLVDAGLTLMMLPYPPRSRPADARSAWPDVLQSFWDVFGHAEQDESDTEERREAEAQIINRVRVQCSQKAVDRLDEVLGWLWHISVARERRAVVARMLTHPVSERPVYSWAKIAKKMGANSRTVKRWHDAGVQAIILGLARE